jgi:hypothetical protein
MTKIPQTKPSDNRVRIIFDDSVVSLTLGGDATLADLAGHIVELSKGRYREPLAIDITVAASSAV